LLLCPVTRDDLIRLLPQGGEIAEIGVANGEFSDTILTHARPRKLHLIDPWRHQARDDYRNDGNNAEDDEQERRYRGVASRFAQQIRGGQVELHRAFSQDVAADFSDGQFDWIYVDGLHSYDGVRSDLRQYKDKVKPEGLILGHDYANHWRALEMNFGVVEAVNEFVADEGYRFVALTHDMFPTYVLARDLEAPAVRHLTAHLLVCVPGVVEIREFPAQRAYQHKIVDISGNIRNLLSF